MGVLVSYETGRQDKSKQDNPVTPDGSLATERRNLLGAIENIGRTLLLVDFGKAGKQYIFDHEVETQREI